MYLLSLKWFLFAEHSRNPTVHNYACWKATGYGLSPLQRSELIHHLLSVFWKATAYIFHSAVLKKVKKSVKTIVIWEVFLLNTFMYVFHICILI